MSKVFIVNNYQGPYFLEIPTHYLLKDATLDEEISAFTKHTIASVDKPGITTWQLTDLTAALKAVVMLQGKKYSFKLLGENDTLFIAHEGDPKDYQENNNLN